MAEDKSYAPAIYRKQGGTTLVVGSGGTIEVAAGGAITYATGVTVTSAAVQAVSAGGGLTLATGAKFTTGVVTATASFTVGAEDSGVTYLIAKTSIIATLPATAAGLQYRFVLTSAGLASATQAGFKVKPVTADAINGNGLTSVDADRLRCAATADREGDFVSIIGDGSNGWYITSISGTWNKATA